MGARREQSADVIASCLWKQSGTTQRAAEAPPVPVGRPITREQLHKSTPLEHFDRLMDFLLVGCENQHACVPNDIQTNMLLLSFRQ